MLEYPWARITAMSWSAIGLSKGQNISDQVARWLRSIGSRLAFRNLTQDRVRLYIAVVGVAFAVLLMTVQLALLIGFATTSSSLIDRSGADLWVVPRGAKNVDQAGTMLDRHKYLASSIDSVASVRSLLVRFAEWKRPDGGTESVIVVGIDPDEPAVIPWGLVDGTVENLRSPDGLLVDELYLDKLGITRLGEIVEITGRRARIVGFTSGVRTFTQSPYVFTTLERARAYSGISSDRSSFFLVRLNPGADIARVQDDVRAVLPGADVWTTGGFSRQTQFYWLVTTGAGAALLIAAIMGMIVGLVIVSQTLYSATVERTEEYATIRAMGAGNRYLKAIILTQSLLSGSLGYVIGIALALVSAWLFRNASAAVSISISLLVFLAITTVIMSVGAALVSIRKVLTVDCASVFR